MKNNRRRLYATIAFVVFLVSAGTAISFVLLHRNSKTADDQVEYSLIAPDDLKEFEQQCKVMTQGQKLYLKHQFEESISRTEMELQSDSLNPEESHEIYLSLIYVRKKLEILNCYLQ